MYLKRGTKVKVIFEGSIFNPIWNIRKNNTLDGYRILVKVPKTKNSWYAVVPAATVTEISDNKKCFSPAESCTCSNGIGCINTPFEKW